MGESGKENTRDIYPAQARRFELNKFLFISLWNSDIDTEHSYRQDNAFWLMLHKSHIALGPGSLVLCTSCSHQWLITAVVICSWHWPALYSHLTNKVYGSWDRHNSTVTSAAGGHSAQSFWGLADMGQVVSLMVTTTLEEAWRHENKNSEPKELALHSMSCSDPCESVYFSQLISRWCQGSILALSFPRGATEVS